MKSIYKEITNKYKNELLTNLANFIEIESVYDESTSNIDNEFGLKVSEALKFIESLAKTDGFKVTNYKNKVVEIIYGEGDKNITILAHADVVPAGEGWKSNPFQLIEKDGVLYGRGVADDKGPLLASYYALKALRDNNMLGNYQVRLLVGGNEENGSKGIEYYFNDLKKPQPTLGFSPDSDFPLIYAEKGIVNFKVTNNIKLPNIIYIKGGTAFNSVIERCYVKLFNPDGFLKYLNLNNIPYLFKDNVVTFEGVSAHGSTPWLGVNAGMIALKALFEYYHYEELGFIYKTYNDSKGKGLNANYYNNEMKDNSLNVGIINYENDQFEMIVNYRYINTCDIDEAIEKISKNSLPYKINVMSKGKLLYYPLDSVLVSTLLQSYRDETNDTASQPLTTGGGTYAKEADNIIAFGMQFPGWDSSMHSQSEKVKIDDLIESMAIYARAIVELGKKL